MKVINPYKFKKFVRTFLCSCINGICLGFVIWQTIKCMIKFIEKPKGTEVSMKKSANLSFPAITVCGLFGKDVNGDDMGLNETYLQNVCGLRYLDYFDGQWANHNCSDPKELFEVISFKPEEIIKNITFQYFTKSDETKYSSIHEFKDWFYHDYAIYGRCVTLAPSHKHSQHGIRSIHLTLLVNSTVVIHTPGAYLKENEQMMSINYVELEKHYRIMVHVEVHELLDYGGDPCNNDKAYQIDVCNANETEMKSLNTVGCTTPYMPNKTKICTDANKGKMAYEIYEKFMPSLSEQNHESCHFPCSYFKVSSEISLVSNRNTKHASVALNFEQLIQDTKSYYIYSGLSFIAEIGGYVGLFLGISINQMANLLDIIIDAISRIYSSFKFLRLNI